MGPPYIPPTPGMGTVLEEVEPGEGTVAYPSWEQTPLLRWKVGVEEVYLKVRGLPTPKLHLIGWGRHQKYFTSSFNGYFMDRRTCNVWGGAVDGFVKSEGALIEGRTRKEPQRPGEDRGLRGMRPRGCYT